MKKRLLLILFSVFLGTSPVQAVTINDTWMPVASEMNLRDIWNLVLNDNFTGSSQDLYNEYGVGSGDPNLESWWGITAGHICAEIRYAGYEQSFGYTTENGESVTLASNIPWGINETSFTFEVAGGTALAWFESWSSGDTQGRWYSETAMNHDGKDHFVAFEVPESLSICNHERRKLYMLGFEDLSLGDQDYQDLVVFLSTVSPSAPVPEPATMLLLGAGLIGLGAMRRSSGR